MLTRSVQPDLGRDAEVAACSGTPPDTGRSDSSLIILSRRRISFRIPFRPATGFCHSGLRDRSEERADRLRSRPFRFSGACGRSGGRWFFRG